MPASIRQQQYGGLGVGVLRMLADKGKAIFTVTEARDVAAELGASPSYVSLLLQRLVDTGLIQRVKRGTYMLTGGFPGFPEAHPFAVGMALVTPSAVSGWSALNHHGLTEQIPTTITLTTPQRVVTPAMRNAVLGKSPSTWEVADQAYEIVTVVPDHFFGLEEIWVGELRASIFDRERALLDCFALPRRFGGIGEGLGILEEHLHELDLTRLMEYALRYGKASVSKRVGWALDQQGAPAEALGALSELPMSGYRLLDPTRPLSGPISARWRLRLNLAAGKAK